MDNTSLSRSGFTLIELSIVLVIIGLVAGGILTGQDLINAAAQRSQIAQIEKYNTAVRTFQGKYGYLPGDMPDPPATNFGFIARGTFVAEGDGNGIIVGSAGANSPPGYGWVEMFGETGVFWVDLSTAGLIDGNFTIAQEHNWPAVHPVTNVGTFFPQAKIGRGNYVYVWSGGISATDGINYWGISAVTKIEDAPCDGCLNSTPGLTVQEAYNIDKKIDDGYPRTGSVQAIYLPEWVARAGTASGSVAVSAATTTCYDNGGNTANTVVYSNSVSAGNNLNCALSFKFQ